MAKKISRKMLLADMNAGMGKTALMNKYGLSEAQFESALRKINEPTSVSGHQYAKRTDDETKAHDGSRCPACNALLSGADTECPKCGIIFAKYHVVEEPLKDGTGGTVHIPDLLKGESVKIQERPMAVWIGTAIGIVVVLAVAFIYFRPWPLLPQSSSTEAKLVTTQRPPQSRTVVETDLDAPDASEESGPELSTEPPGSKTNEPSEVINPPEVSTSQGAVAITPGRSISAEDEAAVPTAEKRAKQPPADHGKVLDALGQAMIQSFDRAVKQWNSEDFRRFTDRARQKLDEASAGGLSQSVREAGEDLIEQLRIESPATAVEAFKRMVPLIRQEVNELSAEAKNNFIKSAQEMKRDLDASITK